MLRSLQRAASGALLAAALPSTAAAATPTILPPVARTLSAASAVPPASGAAPSLVRVHGDPRKLDGLDQLAGFDVTEDRRPGWADVIVDGPDQLATLRRLNLRYDVRIANLDESYAAARRADARYAARVNGVSSLPSGRTEYRTYD